MDPQQGKTPFPPLSDFPYFFSNSFFQNVSILHTYQPGENKIPLIDKN
jgi:hypothetical protein